MAINNLSTRKVTLFSYYIIIFFSLFFSNSISAQVINCTDAEPFCGSSAYNFPNSTSMTAPSGPNYGCLSTQPSPMWYYMQVGSSGSVQMNITQTDNNGNAIDVDYAMWGPFANPTTGCSSIMSGTAPIQSSYSPSGTENAGIGANGGVGGCGGTGNTTPPAAVSGQYYIILVTNYANTTGNVSFTQTGGSGTTNCNIVQPCVVQGITTNVSCSGANAVITGTVTAATGMTTGDLVVSSSCGGSQSFPVNATNFPSGSGVLNYTLSVPGNGQSCTITAQFTGNQLCTNSTTITVPSCCNTPIPTITTVPASCTAAGTATVSNYVATNTYVFSPTGPSVGSGGVISGMTPGTSYTLTANAGGCTSSPSTAFSVQAQLTVPPDPVINVVAPSCTAAGSATITNYNASYTYTFNPTGPSVNGSGVITGVTFGTSYQVTVSSGGGCSAAPVSVTINDILPSPTVSAGSNVSICSGNSTTLTASGASSYSWNNGLGAGVSHSVSPTITTTYIVTGTGANGCTNTSQVTVTVGTATTPTFTNPGAICSGASLTLPTSSTNTPAITGTWSPAANNTATTTYTFTPTAGQCATTTQMTIPVNNNVTPTFINPGPVCTGTNFTLSTSSTNTPAITGTWSPAVNNTATTTYTFTPTAGQCASAITMTVQIDAQVTPTFTNPGPICTGSTLTLPSTSNNGIAGSWSPAMNNTATTTYTFTPSGGGCATTTTMSVVVDNLVAPTFSNPGPICTGSPLSLPTTSNNGVTGTWSPAINNTVTTTYTFTPSNGACAATANLSVVVNQKTTPTFTNPGPVCQGATITLPTVSNDGTSGSWSPAVNNMATTTYTFTPNAGQCANPQTMTITVNPPLTPSFTNPGPICTGDNLLLPASSTNGISGVWSPAVNNSVTTTYTFTPNPNQCATNTTMTVVVNNLTTPTFTIVDTICSGASISLPTTSINGVIGVWSPTINNTATTTYTFVPNASQCANTINKTINVKEAPTIVASIDGSATLCSGDSVKVNILSIPSGAAIQWTATNNNTTGATSGTGNTITDIIKLTNSSNPGTVIYQITGALNGCVSAPTSISYTVNPPIATTSSITSSSSLVEEGGTTNLNVTLNPYIPGALYTWSPSNTLSCNDCPNPIATPDSAVCYVLTVSLPGNCPLQDSVCIKYRIKCGDVFVPSIFSPNGDGSNDYFKVYGRCLVKIQLYVYDRWGNKIYYSDDINEGWDGTFNGKLMNSGTYVYLLHATTLYGETHELKGNVTLTR